MKAALYHLQNPDAEVLYTYFTKALYGQVKYLIEKYYRDFSENRQPNWNKIHILHGWGGKGLRGVYSDTCFENGIIPLSLPEAKFMNPKDPFNYVCEQLEGYPLKQKFELTLIDEGQDFPKYFYRVCRRITKADRIVWAYDDFQNIFDVDIQDEKETFGRDQAGNYYVDFSKNANSLQDIILYKCYRNPRFALISAFSLGLGIYNDKVLQRLENNKHWLDLGFQVEKGNSEDYEQMIIVRPEENSPSDTNKYFSKNAIAAHTFKSLTEECDYIASEIIKDIKVEKLRPDDICVIGLDQKNIGKYFTAIQRRLEAAQIDVFNLLEAPNNNIDFSIENHITLSTINKAKGNEMGVVYVVGIDWVFRNKDFILDRNKLFTAITRSKGWITLTGFESAQQCIDELELLERNDYKLVFKQPSKKDTKTILRGMSEQQSFLNDLSKRIEDFSKVAGLSPDEIIKIIVSQTQGKK
jgi:superfamily I DNA and RNA helicase